MNKTTKILLALGLVALVVGLTVGLSSNRQPSDKGEDRQGSISGIRDTASNGVVFGEPGTADNWIKLTMGTGEQTDYWINNENAEIFVDEVIVFVKHDPNSATTSDSGIVEPSSSYYLDVGTTTNDKYFAVSGASNPGLSFASSSLGATAGFYASGTADTLPFGSIVDRFYLASTTGSGVNTRLAAHYDQMYAELVGSTTVKALGWTFRGDESDLVGLPIRIATSTNITALLYEAGGSYGEVEENCTPGADASYGCQPATSTVRGFNLDIWIHYITNP